MTAEEAPILELKGLTKSFAGVRVLSSVDLAVRRGEVHALIGQNGSGKSTLIKIVSGYHAPDSGAIMMRGEVIPLPVKPGEADRRGLRFLHQDVGVVRTLSVLENLRVGRYETGRLGQLNWPEERRRASRTLKAMGLDIDPDTAVKDVPAAERALIGFARAIQDMDDTQGEVLILDEPTAFLPAPSVEKIFAGIREIASRGSSVVFVSHRLDEVLRISNRVSVLRDGRLIQTVETSRTSQRRLVADMLGRELDGLYPRRAPSQSRRVAASVENFTGRISTGVSFEAHEGEILGLTGLLGMGHDEVPYLMFGAQTAARGAVEIGGRRLSPLSPASAIQARVAFLPADRQHHSGVPRSDSARECLDDFRVALHGRRGLASSAGAVRGAVPPADIRGPPHKSRPAACDPQRRKPAEGAARQMAADPSFTAFAARTNAGRRYRLAEADLADHRQRGGGGNRRCPCIRGICGARQRLPSSARVPQWSRGAGAFRRSGDRSSHRRAVLPRVTLSTLSIDRRGRLYP